MPRNLYDCTAAELATHSVEHLQRDTPPHTAAEWLAEHGYDAAPIYSDDDPVGFIHKDDVTTDEDADTRNFSTPSTTLKILNQERVRN